jgi:hypothetical protein
MVARDMPSAPIRGLLFAALIGVRWRLLAPGLRL